MSTVGSRLAGDTELRGHLADFFMRVSDDEGLPPPGSGVSVGLSKTADRQYRMVNGANFSVRPETGAAAVAAARRAARLLGPVAGHERDVAEALWREAARRATTFPRPEVAESVTTFLKAIEVDAARPFIQVTGNVLFRLLPGVDEVAIGPVKIARGEVAMARYAPGGESDWRLEVGDSMAEIVDGVRGALTLTLAPTCWLVECRAAPRNLREQAAWLVDVGISLLRLAYRETPVSFPHVGEVEAHPRTALAENEHALAVREGGMTWGAPDVPGIYEVAPATAAITQEAAFQARAAAIFDPKPKSVGERVAQGLGWLTRSRRSPDRAERLLHTFTALEALLSQADKRAPVVQTLARHAAVILWATPPERADGARRLRGLYEVRSALVHRGAREVSQSDADTIQYLVEILFWRVLDTVPLERSHAEFCAELAEASYGGPWPPLDDVIDDPDVDPEQPGALQQTSEGATASAEDETARGSASDATPAPDVLAAPPPDASAIG